jgi:hypothetical protein
MVDEFDWCFCSIVQEEVIGAMKVVLISDPVNLVFHPCREVVGVSGSYQDIKMGVIGELNIYRQCDVC